MAASTSVTSLDFGRRQHRRRRLHPLPTHHPTDEKLDRVIFNSFFDKGFNAYSFSFVDQNLFPKRLYRDADALRGDRIVLPPGCLEHLTQFEATTPYQFRLSVKGRQLFCGVIEFSSNPHLAYPPDWMMSYLELSEGDRVDLVNVTLPKCSNVVFQCRKEFLETFDPKTIVEFHLQRKAFLSVGQMIRFEYAKEDYVLTVLKLEPADHVTILNADINFSLTPLEEM